MVWSVWAGLPLERERMYAVFSADSHGKLAESGLMRQSWKLLNRNVPWVQIPHFPPEPDTYGTPLYHRIDYSRVFYSDGIHRMSWVTVQEIRMIFPPDWLGVKPKSLCTHSLMKSNDSIIFSWCKFKSCWVHTTTTVAYAIASSKRRKHFAILYKPSS